MTHAAMVLFGLEAQRWMDGVEFAREEEAHARRVSPMHPTNAMVDSTISSKFYPNAFLLVVQTFRVHLHLSNLFWKRPLCFTALGMFLVRH